MLLLVCRCLCTKHVSPFPPFHVLPYLPTYRFGPTRTDIDNWDYGNFGGSFHQWVQDQIDPNVAGMSVHREFFRQRTNPRYTMDTYIGRPGPLPCSKHSRWRNFAFTAKDTIQGKKFKAAALGLNGAGPYVLHIDGHARTIVENIDLEQDATDLGIALTVDVDYDVCYDSKRYWEESFGEQFQLKVGGSCYGLKDGIPLVHIADIEDQVTVIDLNTAVLTGIDDTTYTSSYWTSYQAGDEYILTAEHNDISCDTVAASIPTTTGHVPIFGKRLHNNVEQYLLYDPRLVLVENTIENPSADGGGQLSIDTGGGVYCANTPRNFLNEDYCFLSHDDSACSADLPPTFSVKLSDGK